MRTCDSGCRDEMPEMGIQIFRFGVSAWSSKHA
jgi:hypothetical protein